jgi:hypothetical protein
MLPCMNSLSNWSPSSTYPRRNPLCISPLSHYVTCPAQLTVLKYHKLYKVYKSNTSKFIRC